jgi:hypothetical protein
MRLSSVCCHPAAGSHATVKSYLAIYLNDQLALGVLWRELARRAQHNNRDSEIGTALAEVATGIAEDVDTFKTIMSRIGVRRNPAKTALAFGAERLARLKPNGRLATYSPLSRFVELEILTMGIEGKKVLWTTLRDLAGLAGRLPDIDFDELIRRADQQRRTLEPHRARTGTLALASPGSRKAIE